jgi:hypothetical protein
MVESGRRRLTSWKEIAAYVSRDVRTVLRWEKERGLPVHRVPGSTGRVVFAYADELDAWLNGEFDKSPPAEHPASVIPAFVPEPVPDPITASHLTPVPRFRTPRIAAGLAVTIVLVSVAAWAVLTARTETPAVTATVTDSAIVGKGIDGLERWSYPLPAGEKVIAPDARAVDQAERMGDGDLVTGTAYSVRAPDALAIGGELLRFTGNGRLKNRFTFADRLTFGAGPYSEPWTITDWRVQEQPGGGSRIAVAAHHFEWWPSVVTILDDQWKRRGTFVNAGWVERVHWLGRDRLLIAGFANDPDGGMIALLDVNALNGQSPILHDDAYACLSCGPAAPLRYIVFPRSEVNRASGAPFNRVVLTVKTDAIVARTIERPANANAPDALYEFTNGLDFVRATYSDRYWEAHRELEAAGRIHHSREQCPDRDGPREIQVWEPETGWTPVSTAPLRAPSSPARSRR